LNFKLLLFLITSLSLILLTAVKKISMKTFFSALKTIMFLSLFGFGMGDAVAQQALPAGTQVPKELQVPSQESPIFKAVAVGSQIYVCKAKADNPQVFEWALKAPQAKLFDQRWQKLGTHYAGPTWEANDGSKIIGQLKAKTNAPQNTAIPWLLLEVKSHLGNGIFSQVNWIQRLHTIGGKPPATECTISQESQEVSISYKADYYFYR
jgi:Protein of unknown function (DUF3455)